MDTTIIGRLLGFTEGLLISDVMKGDLRVFANNRVVELWIISLVRFLNSRRYSQPPLRHTAAIPPNAILFPKCTQGWILPMKC